MHKGSHHGEEQGRTAVRPYKTLPVLFAARAYSRGKVRSWWQDHSSKFIPDASCQGLSTKELTVVASRHPSPAKVDAH